MQELVLSCLPGSVRATSPSPLSCWPSSGVGPIARHSSCPTSRVCPSQVQVRLWPRTWQGLRCPVWPVPLRWVHCVQAWGPWCQASWRAGFGGLHGACPRSRPASGLCVLPSGGHWVVTRGHPPRGGARGLLFQARAYPGAGRGASPALLPVSCSLPFGVFLKGLKCLPFAPIFFLSQDVCSHPLLPSSVLCSQWGSGGSTVPAEGSVALELGNVTTSSGSGSWTTHTTLPCPKMPS